MPDGSAAPPLRILLAEEQVAARDLVTLALGRRHYRIESVASGGSALALARREPADLILLSTTLPDLPGAALIGALRELPRLERVPIVAICHGGAEVRQACTAAGAAACLGRPLEVEGLVELIERLVPPRAQAGAPAQEPVLDVDHLRGFTDGDPQLEGELSALFLSTAEVYLREMREALHEGRAWTAIAHALKGASANLGARGVAALALTAERSAPSRAQLDAIESAIGQVRAFFERTRAPSYRGEEPEGTAGSPREIP
jgi:CheY-like chemotaxis protein/HPt (histidine-containing phosphotransfer) domain-containing protein